MVKKRIIFIINPISGTIKKQGVPGIISDCLDKNLYDYEIVLTKYSGHAQEIAQDAKNQGIDVVVAVGGDGTVNEVARAIVHSDTALGIIPCGSGNGLARHLMIPLEINKAIETLNFCQIHRLDYGLINSHPFFCTCGMGFDALISMRFAEAGRRGVITYLENILREGLRYKPEFYDIESDQGSMRHNAYLVSCANASQYGNNAYIAPHASMNDGFLDVTIIEPFDMIEAPQICIDILNKTLDKNPRVKTLRTRKINIKRDKPGLIHYDGDPVMSEKDVEISIVGKGIKMVINPLADKTKRLPTAMQSAFSDLINDISSLRIDLSKEVNPILGVNKILKRLNSLK